MDPTTEQMVKNCCNGEDKIIERKLKALEADYNLTLKYDNTAVEESVIKHNEDQNKEHNEEQDEDLAEQDKPEQLDEEDEDQFGEYQYECLDDDENPKQVEGMYKIDCKPGRRRPI